MRVLVVDDEPLVRKGLISLLQESGDVSEIFEASNGAAAQEIIERETPDLVFTDIVMPKMDGIELLKWIMAYHPQVRSVVLSSHQDFQYVKKAFIFGAKDYLLKYEVDESSLGALLGSLKSETQPASPTWAQQELPPAQKVQVVCMLGAAQALDATLGTLKEQPGVLRVWPGSAQNYAFAVIAAREGSASPLAWEEGVSAGYSLAGSGLDLERLRAQAETAVNRCFCSGPGSLHVYDPAMDSEMAHEVLSIRNELTADLLGEGIARLYTLLQDLYDAAKKNPQCPSVQVKLLYVSLAELMSIKYKGAFEKRGIAVDTLSQSILESPYLYQIKDIMDGCLQAILDESLQVLDLSGCSAVTRRAAEYINRHFGDGKLGLDTVAEHLGYTPSYLSRLFKKETGVNVVDYLNEVRIMEAKRMVSQGRYKVYEIAEMVGYNNYNYFSKTFKKIVGFSPSDYQDHPRGHHPTGHHPMDSQPKKN